MTERNTDEKTISTKTELKNKRRGAGVREKASLLWKRPKRVDEPMDKVI